MIYIFIDFYIYILLDKIRVDPAVVIGHVREHIDRAHRAEACPKRHDAQLLSALAHHQRAARVALAEKGKEEKEIINQVRRLVAVVVVVVIIYLAGARCRILGAQHALVLGDAERLDISSTLLLVQHIQLRLLQLLRGRAAEAVGEPEAEQREVGVVGHTTVLQLDRAHIVRRRHRLGHDEQGQVVLHGAQVEVGMHNNFGHIDVGQRRLDTVGGAITNCIACRSLSQKEEEEEEEVETK